jgi:thiamine biosynthesis lipoprotein
MASEVIFHLSSPLPDYLEAIALAQERFKQIETSCTRFNDQSALMKANATPSSWHEMPTEAVHIIEKAFEAYGYTKGLFDPRILGDLVATGYDTSISFTLKTAEKEILVRSTQEQARKRRNALPDWKLEISKNQVLLGKLPIDLGGIGKGYAVSEALEILRKHAQGVMVEAGGDIAVCGNISKQLNWRIGIEDPWDEAGEPLAVVELEGGSIATSSLRLRRWIHNGVKQHHLIDPSTGNPGGDGLMAVSVIHDLAYIAEVWSKSLFLIGIEGIAQAAQEEKLAVAWVSMDGNLVANEAFEEKTIWKRD